MEISRLGKQKVRCLISEEEIEDMGFTLDEIMQNGEETREFMDQVFATAERQLGMSFENGVKAVRADFLPNHVLSLTFSMMSADHMLDHLKDLMEDMLGAVSEKKKDGDDGENEESGISDIPEDLPDELKDLLGSGDHFNEGDSEENRGNVKSAEFICRKVTLEFENFDTLLQFAGKTGTVEGIPSSLYKFENLYYLLLDLEGVSEDRAKKILYPAEEFADDIFINWGAPAVIREHGEVLIHTEALEGLRRTIWGK